MLPWQASHETLFSCDDQRRLLRIKQLSNCQKILSKIVTVKPGFSSDVSGKFFFVRALTRWGGTTKKRGEKQTTGLTWFLGLQQGLEFGLLLFLLPLLCDRLVASVFDPLRCNLSRQAQDVGF